MTKAYLFTAALALSLVGCASTKMTVASDNNSTPEIRRPAHTTAVYNIDELSEKLRKMGIVRFYCHTEPATVDEEIFATNAQDATKLYLLKINAKFDSAQMLVAPGGGKDIQITDFSCQ